jgi:hypothetical protein
MGLEKRFPTSRFVENRRICGVAPREYRDLHLARLELGREPSPARPELARLSIKRSAEVLVRVRIPLFLTQRVYAVI